MKVEKNIASDYEMKKVIDADNYKILEEFIKKETQEKLQYYKNTGKWKDVSTDREGDIILWKD